MPQDIPPVNLPKTVVLRPCLIVVLTGPPSAGVVCTCVGLISAPCVTSPRWRKPERTDSSSHLHLPFSLRENGRGGYSAGRTSSHWRRTLTRHPYTCFTGKKLFGESYSGLEYDYRGLINLYDQIGQFITHALSLLASLPIFKGLELEVCSVWLCIRPYTEEQCARHGLVPRLLAGRGKEPGRMCTCWHT